MKITKATTLVGTRLHNREDQWITDRYRSVKADIAVVVIETDEGVTGIGEACAYGNPLQIADWVDWYAPSLVGADVEDLGIVPAPTGSAIVHAVGSAHDFAVAGIDCALWDLRGKRAGLPVSRLIDASAAPTVDVYASGGVRYDWRADPGTLIDEVVGHAADGYSAVKIRLGTYWGWDAVTPQRFLRLFDEVRREVGPGMGLAVDGNSRLSRADALSVARGLEERGALWFEEPIAKDDLEGYVALNRAVSLRISGGESFTTLEQFRPWIERGAFDIVQPDAGVCGITELLKIGRFAGRAGLELIPHSWHNGLMGMANAHAVAALPNASMLEECMVQGPLKWDSLVGGSRVVAGEIALGDAPGFGVSVVDDLETRFPYIEGHYAVEVYRRDHAA